MSTITIAPTEQKTIDRVLTRCKKEGDCLIWQGKYHRWTCEVKYRGRAVNAQRLLIQLLHGYNPTKINKVCGNLKCCNIEHLHYERHGKPVISTIRTCPRCGAKYAYEPQKEVCSQCARHGKAHARTYSNRTRHKLWANTVDFNRLTPAKKKALMAIKAYIGSSKFYEDYPVQKLPGESVADFRQRKIDEFEGPVESERPEKKFGDDAQDWGRKLYGSNKTQRLLKKRRAVHIRGEEQE